MKHPVKFNHSTVQAIINRFHIKMPLAGVLDHMPYLEIAYGNRFYKFKPDFILSGKRVRSLVDIERIYYIYQHLNNPRTSLVTKLLFIGEILSDKITNIDISELTGHTQAEKYVIQQCCKLYKAKAEVNYFSFNPRMRSSTIKWKIGSSFFGTFSSLHKILSDRTITAAHLSIIYYDPNNKID